MEAGRRGRLEVRRAVIDAPAVLRFEAETPAGVAGGVAAGVAAGAGGLDPRSCRKSRFRRTGETR